MKSERARSRFICRQRRGAWRALALLVATACGGDEGGKAPTFSEAGSGGSTPMGGMTSVEDASADAAGDGSGGGGRGGASVGGASGTAGSGGRDASAAVPDAAVDATTDADRTADATLPFIPPRDACETVEICDGIDNDCDGQIDQGNPGGGGTCDTGILGACAAGTITCLGGSLQCIANAAATAEFCNGLDDDCDGVIDQEDPEGGGTCDTGLLGVCSAGTLTCQGGLLVCVQDVASSVELCNGLDDDCDGTADQGNPESGAACTTGLSGPCASGTTECVGGALDCIPPTAAETCNGIDDDCDGVIDNGNPGSGVACSTGLSGSCASGTTRCVGGAIACQPDTVALETCNGIDDDCDGVIDNGDPGGGGSCTTALLGKCAAGTETCQGGALQCVSNASPSAEACNGIDDDCDGAVDNGNPDGGGACTTGLLGACSSGRVTCVDGALDCVADAAVAETCNGIDDDCNGTVDDGDPGGGSACNTGLLGVCAAGTETCQGGAIACVQDTAASVETCNGLDDDCDGTPDQGDPGAGAPCSTGLLGVCAAGTSACQSGTLACVADASPSAELCNGLDDNCDGTTDEGNPEGGAACSTGLPGVCDPGTVTCDDGALSCIQDVTPTFETCNGVDDDCDGAVDDGNPGGGASCTTGLLGACAAGTTACESGASVCVQNVAASAETCNGIDDDCNGTVDDGTNGCGGACDLPFPPGTPCDFVGPNDLDVCEDDAYVCNGPNTTICADSPNDGDGDDYSAGSPTCGGDCDDIDPLVVPGATEICDVIDNDCDGFVDETCTCETYTWDGGGDGATWGDPLNWAPDAVPGGGPNHCVSIPTGVTVSLGTVPTFALRTLSLDGTLTHPPGSIDGVKLSVYDLTVGAAGTIATSGRGYGQNAGPGAGPNGTACACGAGLAGAGAGHGAPGGAGQGGIPAGGATYDAITTPTELGSGGGRRNCTATGTAGLGGGSVRLVIGGTLTLDGTIRADGTTSATNCSNGGGSGGSVWITAPVIATTGSPIISADGGDGTPEGAGSCSCTGIGAGGGAGGRIAIDGYTGSLPEALTLSARGGAPAGGARRGGAGTIFRRPAGQGLGDLEVDNTVAGGSFTPIPASGATSFDAITIRPATTLVTTTPVTVGTLTVEGTLTHATGDADGVNVTATDVVVTETGIVDARGRGFGQLAGPGAGLNGTACVCGAGLSGTGAGHGGPGGRGQGSTPSGGGSYGDIAEPIELGSGGGRRNCSASGTAGLGGGRVRLVTDTLSLDGTIRADGTTSATACSNGGGSGGSIWITVGTVSTTTGTPLISSDGGAGTTDTAGSCSCGAGFGGGGGAGGRISIDGYAGTLPATLAVRARGGAPAGAAVRGAAGTIYRHPAGQALGDLEVDNAVSGGTFTPIFDGTLATFNSVTVQPDTTLTATVPLSVGTFVLDGTLTHPNGHPDGVVVDATNMVIGPTGSVDVTGRGYGQLSGPGAGSNGVTCTCAAGLSGSGAGHGGRGGAGEGGTTPAGGLLYGSVQGAPLDLGSGGGRRNCGAAGTAGIGGGHVGLFLGSLLIEGQIRADGTTSATNCSNGGGSGGSIFIAAGSVSSNGSALISSRGGNGTPEGAGGCSCPGLGAGGGGGGRIAIFADDSSVLPAEISVPGGAGAGGAADGSPGIPFHYPGADSLITLTSPPDGGSGSSSGTVLQWTGLDLLGTRHFHVELDDDPHFDTRANHPDTGDPPITVLSEDFGTPGGRLTTFSWTTPPLASQKTYYWHVVAHNSGNGVVGASRVYRFRTD